MIVHSSNGSLVELDDATETLLGTVNSFPGPTESIVPSQDGLFAYAAIPSIGKPNIVPLFFNVFDDKLFQYRYSPPNL